MACLCIQVMKGAHYGRRADVWSVGCTVLEMFTGKHPWPDVENTWAAIFHIARATKGPPLPEVRLNTANAALSGRNNPFRSPKTKAEVMVGVDCVFAQGLSEGALSFLAKCFAYEPSARPTATKLLQNEFVSGTETAVQDAQAAAQLKHSF